VEGNLWVIPSNGLMAAYAIVSARSLGPVTPRGEGKTTMKLPRIIAWTGGDFVPAGFTSPTFRAVRNHLYREQLGHWREFWGDRPDRDTRSIFKNRAIGDAWATVRGDH
jgi:hypothetical protein